MTKRYRCGIFRTSLLHPLHKIGRYGLLIRLLCVVYHRVQNQIYLKDPILGAITMKYRVNYISSPSGHRDPYAIFTA